MQYVLCNTATRRAGQHWQCVGLGTGLCGPSLQRRYVPGSCSSCTGTDVCVILQCYSVARLLQASTAPPEKDSPSTPQSRGFMVRAGRFRDLSHCRGTHLQIRCMSYKLSPQCRSLLSLSWSLSNQPSGQGEPERIPGASRFRQRLVAPGPPVARWRLHPPIGPVQPGHCAQSGWGRCVPLVSRTRRRK